MFVKQYEQETNYVANILLDGSESMMYASGEHSKLQYGKMLAAVLSYLFFINVTPWRWASLTRT